MKPGAMHRPAAASTRIGLAVPLLAAWLLAIAACSSCKHPRSKPQEEPPAQATARAVALPAPALTFSAPAAPSGYLLITAARMPALAAKVKAKAPEWITLKDNVDEHMDQIDFDRSSPENIALVHLLTRDARYAAGAYRWAKHMMDTRDPRDGSYLPFGDIMRSIALVLSYCRDALSPAQRAELAGYLDRFTHELWFANKGSGWGLEDAGNNYHMAFLEGTAFAGYALRAVGHPKADEYLALVTDRLEREGGVIAYLNARAPGGDLHEGANYGQRSKQRLFNALSTIASMGGKNYFGASPFFAGSVVYALYAIQPGNQLLYPSGDLARSTEMPVSPYDRDYLQMLAYWLPDGPMRGHAQWLLTNVVPSYDGNEFSFRGAYYKDVIFKLTLPAVPPSHLPLSYRAAGTDFVNLRSGWGPDATSVTISGTPHVDQSHAHHDVGSFTVFKKAWLAVDAASFGTSGLNWDAGSHNMIHVPGHERSGGSVPGLAHFQDDAHFAYVQVDASNLFRRRNRSADRYETLLDEYTRELVYLRPDTLVVYDRVAPQPASKTPDVPYDWRLHFPVKPTISGNRTSAAAGGAGISVVTVAGSAPRIVEDSDLVEGGSKAWRLTLTSPTPVGRFLNVVQAAAGAPPTPVVEPIAPAAGAAVAGVVLGSGEVVVFSAAARGEPAATPFSFTVPGTGKRTFVFANLRGSYDVTLTRAGETTTVQVAAGSRKTASAAGVLSFTD